MRSTFTIAGLIVALALAGCDMRSGMAKKEMERFSGTPTPAMSPVPTEAPPDPADAVTVDTSVQGDLVNVNGHDVKKTASCPKYNQLMVNGNRNVITIKGVCRQIMINGDGNQVVADAAAEFVINGETNTLKYVHFVNGKRPFIKQNSASNIVEKIKATEVKH